MLRSLPVSGKNAVLYVNGVKIGSFENISYDDEKKVWTVDYKLRLPTPVAYIEIVGLYVPGKNMVVESLAPTIIIPAVCECGAAKIGIVKYNHGHSLWCPVAPQS